MLPLVLHMDVFYLVTTKIKFGMKIPLDHKKEMMFDAENVINRR